MSRDIVILAPHPDDEVIGCYTLFNRVSTIFYLETVKGREQEYQNLCNDFNFDFYKTNLDSFESDYIEFSKHIEKKILLVPDPFTEYHPLHKRAGLLGYSLLKKLCNVVFYTTNMNTNYLFEVNNCEDKKTVLNHYYNSQQTLWEYDNKYFLFEGHCDMRPFK